MRAVLLFSAVLHIAAIGALAAFGLRAWLHANRPKEPTFAEFATAALALGVVVAVAGTILSWMGRGFGVSVTTGLAAGGLAGLAFMLTLGTLPPARPEGAEPSSRYARLSTFGLVGALVLTEVVAFCLLVATASRTNPWS